MRMIDLQAKPFCLDQEAVTWVHTTLSELSQEEKVGQLFCILYKEGTRAEMEEISRVMQPGGAMYRSIPLERAVALTNALQEQSKIPLLLAANLEKGGNGIVQEGTLLGSPLAIAATDDVAMAERLGLVCGREGRAVGANWAFAPIIDIDSNFRNPITNTRTFGDDPQRVTSMGCAYVRQVQQLGVAACIKHFPGDGQDERDQHLVTSINDLSCEAWDETYGRAYAACIEEGALSVMVGHIMQPAYTRYYNPGIADQDILPASLSPELLQGLLRGKLGFNGLIATDATTMAGFTLAMSRRDAVPAAIEAGCDMFLFCRNLEEDYRYMLDAARDGRLSERRLNEAVCRILATKAALGLHRGVKKAEEETARQIVGCAEHQAWARDCADQAITLVKEQPGVLPITREKYRRILFHAIESSGGVSQYAVRAGACQYIMDRLIADGFEVDLFEPPQGSEGKTTAAADVIGRYDLILYVANLATRSNQTTVRIEWAQPMGANCMHYYHDVPTVFVSLENPYHLLDVPRVRTYINTYNSSTVTLDSLMEKLLGRDSFRGVNPVDPFCGKWDTHL